MGGRSLRGEESVTETAWPDHQAPYEDGASGERDQIRWQRAFEDAFAAGSLRLEDTGTDVIHTLRGRCPRCGHELEPIDVYSEVIFGVTQVKHGVAITNIVCTCELQHPRRPDGKAGCGWAPQLTVKFIWPKE